MPRAIVQFPLQFQQLVSGLKSALILSFVLVIFLPLCLFGVNWVKDSALDSRKAESMHVVEAAVNVTQGYYDAFRSGAISETDAKKAAIAVLDRMYYDKTNYVFGYDYKSKPGQAILIFNRVRPELVGQDRMAATTPDGVKYVQAGVNVAKNGGGFYTYNWNAGGTSPTPRPKLSYAASFEPWGWMIGTGSYVDDILNDYWANVAFVITLFAGLLALGTAISEWLYGKTGW